MVEILPSKPQTYLSMISKALGSIPLLRVKFAEALFQICLTLYQAFTCHTSIHRCQTSNLQVHKVKWTDY